MAQLTYQELVARDTANGKLGKINDITGLVPYQSKESAKSNRVDSELAVLAEFCSYYGWEAAQLVRTDTIKDKEFKELLEAMRVVEAMNRYNRVVDTYTAVLAAQPSKDGKNTKALKTLLTEIEKQWQTT